MRASWSALHTSLTRLLNRKSSEAEFQLMRTIHSDLAPFASIASLLEHQHGPGGDAAARFRVVRALVEAAQSDQEYRTTAQVMVILTLWPGLDAVLWRLARGFPAARDDLPADILGRVGEAVLVVDLDRVTALVATLLLNLERDIRRALIAAKVIGQALWPIDDPSVEAKVAAMAAPLADEQSDISDRLAGLNSSGTSLLRRVFILGETQEQAGKALGLSPSAARKRYQRALAKLRAQQKNSPALSHSGPATGL